MKTIIFLRVALLTIASAITTVTYANEYGQNLIYLGAGAADSGDQRKSSITPMSLGYLRVSNTSDAVWGFDVSGEGTMLDSTWGQRSKVKQATSFNLLIGRNLSRDENSRFDISLLAGMREKFSDCPSSYLGYQCYADTAPKTSYGLNYGAVLTWTYKSYMLGVRVTDQSQQALVGFRF